MFLALLLKEFKVSNIKEKRIQNKYLFYAIVNNSKIFLIVFYLSLPSSIKNTISKFGLSTNNLVDSKSKTPF